MAYSIEQRIRAKELFCERGYSYDDVAAETGVSVQNLKKWGTAGKWKEERDEIERDVIDLRAKLRRTAVKKLNKLGDDPDAQQIYALLKLLDATFKPHAAPAVDKAALFLEWAEGLIAFLKQRDADALKYLQPHIQGYAEAARSQE